MSEDIISFDNVIRNISSDIRTSLASLPGDIKKVTEEIRLRNGSPLNINFQGNNYFVTANDILSSEAKDGIIINQTQINNTFQLITNHSIYAFTEEIRRGFITVEGGHRIGIGGTIIYGNNGIENIRDISSLNIRIAKEKKGISDFIIPYLVKDGDFYNSLIISPPQCGKTTLLRDLVRNLSNGDLCKRGFKIGLIDERSEIAGVYNGLAQNDVGIRTDILNGCRKSDGIMMFIRSMSPEIIAIDEIGGREDIEALEEGLRAGIRFIASIHGYDLNDLRSKVDLKKIIKDKIFKRYIIMDNSKGVGTIASIVDGENMKELYSTRGGFLGSS